MPAPWAIAGPHQRATLRAAVPWVQGSSSEVSVRRAVADSGIVRERLPLARARQSSAQWLSLTRPPEPGDPVGTAGAPGQVFPPRGLQVVSRKGQDLRHRTTTFSRGNVTRLTFFRFHCSRAVSPTTRPQTCGLWGRHRGSRARRGPRTPQTPPSWLADAARLHGL